MSENWLLSVFKRIYKKKIEEHKSTSVVRATSFIKQNVYRFYYNVHDIFKRHEFEVQNLERLWDEAIKKKVTSHQGNGKLHWFFMMQPVSYEGSSL